MFLLMYLNWCKTFGYMVYNVFWLIYNLFLCIFLMFELVDVKFLFLYTYIYGKIKYIFKLWKPVELKMISRPVQLKKRFFKTLLGAFGFQRKWTPFHLTQLTIHWPSQIFIKKYIFLLTINTIFDVLLKHNMFWCKILTLLFVEDHTCQLPKKNCYIWWVK